MSWLFIGLAVLILIVYLLYAANRSFRAHARRELIDYLRKHLPHLPIEEHSDRLEIGASGKSGTLYLRNFYAQMAKIRPDDIEGARQVHAQFAGMIRESIERRAIDPERDRERVLPRLVTADFLDSIRGSGHEIPFRPFADTGLRIAYVLDGEYGMEYIKGDTLNDLGLTSDTLHDLALENLRRRSSRDIVRTVIDKGNVSVLKSGDGYDATRLLLVPEYLEGSEALAAAIPDQDTLVIAPTPRDHDWSRLRKMAQTFVGRPLLPLPLTVSRTGVTVVR